MIERRYVYSACGEHFNHDNPEDAIDEAISNCLPNDFKVGASLTYHKALAKDYKPSDFVTKYEVNYLLDGMNERSSEDAGEYGGDFPEPSSHAKETLLQLVKSWADSYLTCNFWGVEQVEDIQFEVTPELYEQYK